MMKFLIALVMGLVPMISHAQTAAYQQPDPGKNLSGKVLVFPFHPTRTYFSDCDQAIAGESKIRPMQVRKNFQQALDQYTQEELARPGVDLHPVNMTAEEGQVFLKRYYRSVHYSYEEPSRVNQVEETPWLNRFRKRLSDFRFGKKKATAEVATTPKDKEEYSWLSTRDDKYLAVRMTDSQFFEDLDEAYAPDYIVTINQFEVKTDYRKCIDRELENYTRRFRIHFNVFSPQGEELFGEVVTVNYNSTTEDIEKLIADNFTLIGEYIGQSLSSPDVLAGK